MPGIAEQPGEERPREAPSVEESTAPSDRPEEQLREVRYVRRGPTYWRVHRAGAPRHWQGVEMPWSGMCAWAMRAGCVEGGGEVQDSLTSSQPGSSGYMGDDQGYDSAT